MNSNEILVLIIYALPVNCAKADNNVDFTRIFQYWTMKTSKNLEISWRVVFSSNTSNKNRGHHACFGEMAWERANIHFKMHISNVGTL